MSSGFEEYGVDRVPAKRGREHLIEQVDMPAEGKRRTTLSLSLRVSDKKALKLMALQRETTIAAIIHEWVQEHLEEVDG